MIEIGLSHVVTRNV